MLKRKIEGKLEAFHDDKGRYALLVAVKIEKILDEELGTKCSKMKR